MFTFMATMDILGRFSPGKNISNTEALRSLEPVLREDFAGWPRGSDGSVGDFLGP